LNQFPTTSTQLEIYKELDRNDVKYALIGALAARFYGRNRATKDIDLLVESSVGNCIKVRKSLLNLGYPAGGIKDSDFVNYEYIRIGGRALVDLHSSYFGIRFEVVSINWFEYEGVKIAVASKESLIKLMSKTRVNSEDVRILRLLNDPITNADELNLSQ